jgi:hypothetical protein
VRFGPSTIRSAAAWLAAWTLAGAGPARAADGPPPGELRLEWSAPAGCPRTEEVRARVASALGRPVVEGARPTSVRARVRAQSGGFVLDIETRGPAGEVDARRLQDRRCEVLAEATAVIAATAIDRQAPRGEGLVPPAPGGGEGDAAGLSPGTGSSGTGDAGASPPGAGLSPGTGAARGELSPGTGGRGAANLPPGTGGGGANVSPGTGGSGANMSSGAGGRAVAPGAAGLSPGTGLAPAIELSPGTGRPDPALDDLPARGGAPSASPAGPRLRGALRLLGVGDVGSVAGGTGGVAGGGALLGRGWRVELSALWLAPRTRVVDADAGLSARVGLVAGALRGCAVPGLRRLEFPVCAGLEVGALRGRGEGEGLGIPRVDALGWVAAVVGPAVAWPVTRRLALVLQVDAVVPLLRPRFEVGGFGPVHETGAAAGRAALGVEVRLP